MEKWYIVSVTVIDNGNDTGNAYGVSRGLPPPILPMQTRPRIRIQDVAAMVGVSTQTVSRVLNNKPDVSRQTRQRVLDIIAELGYQPNMMARGLVSNRTYTIGMFTEDFTDPFYAQIIVAAEAEARAHGYYLLLCSAERNSDIEYEYFRLLASRHVDGVLLLRPGSEEQPRYLHEMVEKGIPLVPIAYDLHDSRVPLVDVDNIDGGYKATRCLIDEGHRQIAMITGPIWNKAAVDRKEGYRIALQDANIPFDVNLLAYGDWSYESGYHATWQLLSRVPQLTGIFVHNDRMAIAAMQAIRESGRAIPNDISIVGYDDIQESRFINPPLTTIRQPAGEIGRVATSLLMEMIHDPDALPQRLLLKTELVYRKSCAGKSAFGDRTGMSIVPGSANVNPSPQFSSPAKGGKCP